MTFVELFFFCDEADCKSHAYVPSDRVNSTIDFEGGTVKASIHIIPPPGWHRRRLDGKTFCPEHV